MLDLPITKVAGGLALRVIETDKQQGRRQLSQWGAFPDMTYIKKTSAVHKNKLIWRHNIRMLCRCPQEPHNSGDYSYVSPGYNRAEMCDGYERVGITAHIYTTC